MAGGASSLGEKQATSPTEDNGWPRCISCSPVEKRQGLVWIGKEWINSSEEKIRLRERARGVWAHRKQ
jgi:hypothetical protein